MPLSQAHTDIIKATVPILKTGGEALTTHFYKMLFRDFPQVKIFFNSTHQTSGDQPRALANSVLCYAENIETLENLGPLAAQIVNKHVALQIQPEHYPIVGQCLLLSIREVLGAETATDAVLEAWGAAYQQLADILIGAEAAQYKAMAEAEGGWMGARTFTVAKKVVESSLITSLYLTPVDGKAVVRYQSGQYLGLQLFVKKPSANTASDDETVEIRRNYSISQAADGKTLRISVKRECNGAASNYLHDAPVGTELNVFPPSGPFVLKKKAADDETSNKKNIVLLSAGVGITPMMAMLQELVAATDDSALASSVTFIHVAKNSTVQAFAADVEALVAAGNEKNKQTIFSNTSIYTEGLITPQNKKDTTTTTERDAAVLEKVIAAITATANNTTASPDVYLLGPKSFMKAMRDGLVASKVAEKANIMYEFFGPAASLE